MKFFQKRGVAVAVMVLAVVASIAWGQYKKPASLPQVRYGVWICDDAELLSDSTETLIGQYNAKWNGAYRALCAVATVRSTRGWKLGDYTATLGENWGLGENDLLLLLVDAEDGPTWYVNGGAAIMDGMTDSDEKRIQFVLDDAVYGSERWDEAVTSAFGVLDSVYAMCYGGSGSASDDGWQDTEGTGSVLKTFLIVLFAAFVLWVVLDRLRYNGYRRRVASGAVPAARYVPIFWGRGMYKPRPTVTPQPHTNYRPPSGGGGYTRPPSSGGSHTRPSGSHARPSGSSRPSSGFGRTGGFGGGSRGGGMTRGGGFGGGRR